VAHLKQQKLDVSINFHALFHNYNAAGFYWHVVVKQSPITVLFKRVFYIYFHTSPRNAQLLPQSINHDMTRAELVSGDENSVDGRTVDVRRLMVKKWRHAHKMLTDKLETRSWLGTRRLTFGTRWNICLVCRKTWPRRQNTRCNN